MLPRGKNGIQIVQFVEEKWNLLCFFFPSDAARRVPATLRQGRIADDPTSLRVVNYFSIGICFYLGELMFYCSVFESRLIVFSPFSAATLLGLGIFHLWTGGVSAYASLGANPKSVISRLAALEQDPKNSEYSAFLAAAAVAQRMEHSSYVCLAILLAYTSYMFDFSRKAVLHMAGKASRFQDD